jgi:hypothetical protein
MTRIIRLQPHEQLPETGQYVVLMRRLGEDDPNAVVTELIVSDGQAPPMAEPVVNAAGEALDFEAAIKVAAQRGEAMRLRQVYVVDRTAGHREHEVLDHHGDHAWRSETLSDTDPEDGERGTSLRDRPRDAGYLR